MRNKYFLAFQSLDDVTFPSNNAGRNPRVWPINLRHLRHIYGAVERYRATQAPGRHASWTQPLRSVPGRGDIIFSKFLVTKLGGMRYRHVTKWPLEPIASRVIQLDTTFTAWCAVERCYAIVSRQSVRLSVCDVGVRCSYSFEFPENNYSNISLGSSLLRGKEASICFKRIIQKFRVEQGLSR